MSREAPADRAGVGASGNRPSPLTSPPSLGPITCDLAIVDDAGGCGRGDVSTAAIGSWPDGDSGFAQGVAGYLLEARCAASRSCPQRFLASMAKTFRKRLLKL